MISLEHGPGDYGKIHDAQTTLKSWFHQNPWKFKKNMNKIKYVMLFFLNRIISARFYSRTLTTPYIISLYSLLLSIRLCLLSTQIYLKFIWFSLYRINLETTTVLRIGKWTILFFIIFCFSRFFPSLPVPC